jgi:hypothetical protein
MYVEQHTFAAECFIRNNSIIDRFGAGLKQTRPMKTVHKPENVEGFKVTFGEVHIVLPEDMHYH